LRIALRKRSGGTNSVNRVPFVPVAAHENDGGKPHHLVAILDLVERRVVFMRCVHFHRHEPARFAHHGRIGERDTRELVAGPAPFGREIDEHRAPLAFGSRAGDGLRRFPRELAARRLEPADQEEEPGDACNDAETLADFGKGSLIEREMQRPRERRPRRARRPPRARTSCRDARDARGEGWRPSGSRARPPRE